MGRNLLINIKAVNIPVVFTNFDYHSRQPQILKAESGNTIVFISHNQSLGYHEIVGIFKVSRTYVDNVSWRAQKWGQNTVEGIKSDSFLIRPIRFTEIMPQLSWQIKTIDGQYTAMAVGGATQSIRFLEDDDVKLVLSYATRIATNPYTEMAAAVGSEKLHLDAQIPLSRRVNILERNLEDITVEMIENLEPGLKYVGRQVSTPAGIIDILCQDEAQNLVIVELKRGKISDQVVGQLSRYMGWAIDHKTHDPAKVRGIIVAQDFDDKVRFAAKSNPHISLKTFSLSFQDTKN